MPLVNVIHAIFTLNLLIGLQGPVGNIPKPASNRDQTHLVVLIVIDQFRADYLTRFAPYFADTGFRRLMHDGAHFVNAYFSYGAAATAPGHATISTGRIPRQHGIVANKWYLAADTQHAQYAVTDQSYRPLPAPTSGRAIGKSPHFLIGPTIGDQIKVSDTRSRVFSVALKDRAAIFLGGHHPDGAFWWNLFTGRFGSSTYYGESLPAYVQAFNDEKVADQYVGRRWKRLRDKAIYAGRRAVKADWSSRFAQLGTTFPHVLPAVGNPPGLPFYAALWTTPFGNDLVLDMVGRILTHEKLGQGPAVDLLCIGFSSNDLVGHYFGPDSPEVMDMTLQTDRQIATLLAMLDKYVGLNHCLIALTGDHGVTTHPYLAHELGLGGGTLDLKALSGKLNEQLQTHFAQLLKQTDAQRIVLNIELPWVYLNRSVLQRLDTATRTQLITEAADFFRGTDGIEEVFTANQLAGPMPDPADLHRSLAWRCYHRQRSGQLYLQLQPYWYKKDTKIAGHTSGFSHDRHVPIILFGPRVRPGRYFSPARPSDIAVTLAALLGIEPPLDATGHVLYQAIDTRPGG